MPLVLQVFTVVKLKGDITCFLGILCYLYTVMTSNVYVNMVKVPKLEVNICVINLSSNRDQNLCGINDRDLRITDKVSGKLEIFIRAGHTIKIHTTIQRCNTHQG